MKLEAACSCEKWGCISLILYVSLCFVLSGLCGSYFPHVLCQVLPFCTLATVSLKTSSPLFSQILCLLKHWQEWYHGACLLVLLLVTLSPFTFISFTNGGGRKFSARCKHLMQTAASCGLESDFQMARSIVNVICHRIVKTALVKVDDVTVIKSSCNWSQGRVFE